MIHSDQQLTVNPVHPGLSELSELSVLRHYDAWAEPYTQLWMLL